MAKTHFLIVNKFKNTGSAQLWTIRREFLCETKSRVVSTKQEYSTLYSVQLYEQI